MNKRSVWAWIMYDFANSAYATTVLAVVLPIFYSQVAAATLDSQTASSYLGYTHSVGMLFVALLAPILGAAADRSGKKGNFLRTFSLLGMAATLGFVFIGEGDWLAASTLLVLSTIGFAGANTFYDALLPDLVPSGKREYVSSQGYAYGYIGGGLLLAVNLLMIQQPEWFGLPDTLAGTRLAFASVAVWWLVFSIPIFRVSSKPGNPSSANGGAGNGREARSGFAGLVKTFRELARYPELLKFMAAFWFFNDGINTIILMATIYGTSIGIGSSDLILALLITQFVGFPCTLLLGKLAERFGAKKLLYLSLACYVLIVGLGYFMTSALHFYLLAGMVGLVQGGSQSLARSLFSELMPAKRTGEFFGFVNVTGKFSSIFGPFVFGLVGQITGSTRWGILSLLAFFVIGMALMAWSDMEKGRREAQEDGHSEAGFFPQNAVPLPETIG
ncbi:MFS transporter [Paenibacillus yonginensis]|uniref:MFS transporter n=1 Tax=Paenibacillus yonginensis TaxID=1462996 RepID=A0A1B1MWB1_9BACL|nr:MFS transporter [Paenibacillus yonginensis]ANS73472.1 MFS transporter [Paenibacillus yonginensis]